MANKSLLYGEISGGTPMGGKHALKIELDGTTLGTVGGTHALVADKPGPTDVILFAPSGNDIFLRF